MGWDSNLQILTLSLVDIFIYSAFLILSRLQCPFVTSDGNYGVQLIVISYKQPIPRWLSQISHQGRQNVFQAMQETIIMRYILAQENRSQFDA